MSQIQKYCKRGHEFTADNTYVSPTTGYRQCRSCTRLRSKTQYHKNPNKSKEQAYKRREKDPERYNRLRKRARWKQHGMNPDEAEHAMQKNTACQCCKANGDTVLMPDHCHKTGKVRGVLCHKCNAALGLLGDDINGVVNLITYLQQAG